MAKASQFLKLTDRKGLPVKGESYNADHMGEIDLTGWNWGAEDPAVKRKASTQANQTANATVGTSNRSISGSGGGRSSSGAATAGAGEGDDRIKPTLFSITKPTDKATIRLINAMDNGEVFPKALLTIKEEFLMDTVAGREPFKLEIAFVDIFFVKLSWSVSAGRAGLEFDESWDFNYKEVHFSYHYRGEQGQGVIPARFIRPAESSQGASTRSPLSAAEQRASEDKKMEEWAKRNGWTRPGKK